MLKTILKGLYSGCKKFIDTLVSFALILFFSRYHRKNLSYYKKIIKNKDKILILGNGPSLKKSLSDHHSDFEKYPLFVVNNFFNGVEIRSLHPEYYVVCDPAYYREGVEYADSDLQQNFIDFINTVDWPINVFVLEEFRKFAKKNKFDNKNINFIYINETPIDGFKSIIYYLCKKNIGMLPTQNITNVAIFIAINLGFKEIDVYGIDHSWTQELRVNDNNETGTIDHHFYDDGKEHLRILKGFDMALYIGCLSKVFRSHKILEDYSKVCGSKIYNCTPGSFVDAYERKLV